MVHRPSRPWRAVVRSVAALCTAVACCGSPALADVLVLDCERVGPRAFLGFIEDVNQVVINDMAPSVTLRAASRPTEWVFENNRERGDVLWLLRSGESIAISAIRDGSPAAMALNLSSGLFVCAWVTTQGTKAVHFRCDN
jgi:hypothetical protein